MVVDVYLCPVPAYANPPDVRLRVNGPGACGGAVVFVPFNRQAMLAVRMWEDPLGLAPATRRIVQIAGVIPPAAGFYIILLDD